MTRAQMRRAINNEIKRETGIIRGNLAQARKCRQKAEACIRNGDSKGVSACLKLEREYMDAVDRETRRIDGKTKIRDIVDEAAEGATELEIQNAGTAEGDRELREIHNLRREAGDLTAEGIRLMGQGRIAQGAAKLQ